MTTILLITACWLTCAVAVRVWMRDADDWQEAVDDVAVTPEKPVALNPLLAEAGALRARFPGRVIVGIVIGKHHHWYVVSGGTMASHCRVICRHAKSASHPLRWEDAPALIDALRRECGRTARRI